MLVRSTENIGTPEIETIQQREQLLKLEYLKRIRLELLGRY